MDKEDQGELQRAFGQRIRELRLQHKLTQEELSVRVGLTVVSISHLERGVHAPMFNRLPLFAEVFDMEIWELFAPLAVREADSSPSN